MHVGLNLIFLVPGETGGMEVVARELIPALLEAAPAGTRFTAFVGRDAAEGDGPWRDLIPSLTLPVRARSRLQWVVAEQALLPPLAARRGVQLLHSLASTAPVWGRFRRVVTVHDLIYARFPEAHGGLRARGMSVLVPAGIRAADRVIAISQSTRSDLIELLGLDPARIDVVPNGIGIVHRAAPTPQAQLRAELGLGEREVLLTLSAKRAHKNLPRLLEALALIPPERRPLLVMPGYATEHELELRAQARALGLERDVRFLGWVGGSQLEGLWAVAKAFVFPTLYEGFGLPVLEAMARGVPVACSNASSLPEVAGDAALLFDPHDRGQIAAAIRRLLEDPAEAERLRARGLARAREFSWRRTAELTLASYERTLAAG